MESQFIDVFSQLPKEKLWISGNLKNEAIWEPWGGQENRKYPQPSELVNRRALLNPHWSIVGGQCRVVARALAFSKVSQDFSMGLLICGQPCPKVLSEWGGLDPLLCAKKFSGKKCQKKF